MGPRDTDEEEETSDHEYPSSLESNIDGCFDMNDYSSEQEEEEEDNNDDEEDR